MSIPLPRFQPIIPQLQILSISGAYIIHFSLKSITKNFPPQSWVGYTLIRIWRSRLFFVLHSYPQQYLTSIEYHYYTTFLAFDLFGFLHVSYQMNTTDYVVDQARCQCVLITRWTPSTMLLTGRGVNFFFFCYNLLLLTIWRTVMPSVNSVYAMEWGGGCLVSIPTARSHIRSDRRDIIAMFFVTIISKNVV